VKALVVIIYITPILGKLLNKNSCKSKQNYLVIFIVVALNEYSNPLQLCQTIPLAWGALSTSNGSPGYQTPFRLEE